MALLTYAQLKTLAKNAGFPSNLLDTMAAIALAESGGNSYALNANDNGGRQSSYGLWQISTGTHTPPSAYWADPQTNANLAYQKWRQQGLYAWGTYTSGAYKKYLNGAGYDGGGAPPSGGGAGASSGGGSASGSGGSSGASGGMGLSDILAAGQQQAQVVTTMLASVTGGPTHLNGFDDICTRIHEIESFHLDTSLLTAGNPFGWALALVVDNLAAAIFRSGFVIIALLLIIYSLSDVIEYGAGLALMVA